MTVKENMGGTVTIKFLHRLVMTLQILMYLLQQSSFFTGEDRLTSSSQGAQDETLL